MGCPSCKTDFENLEKMISNGEITDEPKLKNELAKNDLFLVDGMVVYCPSCRETIARLKARIASRLRKETLAGIKDLLGRALDEKMKD